MQTKRWEEADTETGATGSQTNRQTEGDRDRDRHRETEADTVRQR